MPVVERDVVLPVTRERAWELITEPADLEEWLADHPEGTRFIVTEHRFVADGQVWGPALMALSEVSARCLA